MLPARDTVTEEMQPHRELLTVKEVACRLKLSESLVYRLIERKQIACHRVGTGRGRIRITSSDLEDYLQRCKQGVEKTQNRKTRQRYQLKHLKL